MKKPIRILLIVAAVLLGTGIVLTTAAFLIARGEDFGTAETNEATYDIADPFTSISIDSLSDQIRFAPSENGTTYVHAIEREGFTHRLTVENDTLHIKEKDNRKWYERVSFSLFPFGMKPSTLQLTVYLPAEAYRDLTIDSVSGSVQLPAAFTFDKVSVKTVSGSIDLNHATIRTDLTLHSTSGAITASSVKAGTADIKTTSGQIKVHDHTSQGNVIIHSTSGSLNLERLTSAAMDIACTSGRIHLSDLTADGRATIKCTSGDMRIESVTCREFEAACTSGDTTIREILCEGTMTLKATSGDMEATDLSGASLNSATVSGDMDLTRIITTDNITIKATSGDVQFTDCDSASLDLKSTSGSFKGSLCTPKQFSIETKSGRVSTPKETGSAPCRIKTVSGDIELTYAD